MRLSTNLGERLAHAQQFDVCYGGGEGKRTVIEALDLNIPVPVIASSLFARNVSKIDNSFSAKVVATMRNQFGGHTVTRNEGP